MYDWDKEEDAGRFVNTYADIILRLTLAHGLSKQDAQDICQELFLKLLTEQRSFNDAEHEKAWIIRAAGNLCKNLLRSPHHRKSAPLEDARSIPMPQKDKELLELIRGLPKNSRMAVGLYYFEGYSMEETAQILGISNPAVRKRLERARTALKKELKGELT